MKHLVGHVDGVWISQARHLEIIMNRIAERSGFNVVSRAFHQFEPHGATGVLLLSEGHLSTHTYPERNMIYIDVFSCNADLCSSIIEEEFAALHGEWRVIER